MDEVSISGGVGVRRDWRRRLGWIMGRAVEGFMEAGVEGVSRMLEIGVEGVSIAVVAFVFSTRDSYALQPEECTID